MNWVRKAKTGIGTRGFAVVSTIVSTVVMLSACTTTLPKAPVELPTSLVRYYDITGSTPSALRKELDAKGPKENGRGFDAHTQWYFRWEWPGYGRLSCDLSAAVVSADIEVTFPRWLDAASAPPKLQDRWQRYVHALTRHENGHVELALQHREIILQAIRSSTCAEADASARQAVQTLNAANARYDQTTKHGRKDGATFP